MRAMGERGKRKLDCGNHRGRCKEKGDCPAAFAPDAIERVRAQQTQAIEAELDTPSAVAAHRLAEAVYGKDHPLGRSANALTQARLSDAGEGAAACAGSGPQVGVDVEAGGADAQPCKGEAEPTAKPPAAARLGSLAR